MAKSELQDVEVLVIDDDQFFRELLKITLGKLGISRVTAAGSAKTAIEFIELGQTEFDVILLDLDMPGMNGVAFLQEIRGSSDQRIADLPVIIVSGHDSLKVRDGMEPFGILGFLGKPPALDQLEKLLSSVA